jgi:hypothetical protein
MRTKAIVHKVTPRATDAHEARNELGLSQREFASLIGTGRNGNPERAIPLARRAHSSKSLRRDRRLCGAR